MYYTKYSHISLGPKLLIFPDSISYSFENKSLPLSLVSPASLFSALLLGQLTSSNVPVHLLSNPFDNGQVGKCSGDVGLTLLVVVYDEITHSSDNSLVYILRMYWA
jgi:hypothetical protein